MSDSGLLKQNGNQFTDKGQSQQATPSFRLHMPEDRRYEASNGVSAGAERWVKVDANAPKQNPPVRQQPPQAPKPPMTAPIVREVTRPQPPQIPKPQPETRRDSEKRFHIPEQQKFDQNIQGKKVITQAADKLVAIRKTEPIGELFTGKKELTPSEDADLNLISEKYDDVVLVQFWTKVKSLVMLVLLFVIIFACGFAGIKFYKLSIVTEFNTIKTELQQLEKDLTAFNSEQVQSEKLKKRAQLLQEVLANHVYWTNIFDKLEHSTQNNVYYTNFMVDETGKLTLSAVAVNYQDAAEQLAILQKADFVSEVEMNAITQQKSQTAENKETTAVQFNINMKLKETSLLK